MWKGGLGMSSLVIIWGVIILFIIYRVSSVLEALIRMYRSGKLREIIHNDDPLSQTYKAIFYIGIEVLVWYFLILLVYTYTGYRYL